MSYNLTLQCGCIVYVACDPKTGLSHTRIVELRGQHCRIRHHDDWHRVERALRRLEMEARRGGARTKRF